MSEKRPENNENMLVLGLSWLGVALVVLGVIRLITGLWSPEAAEYAGSSNTPVAIGMMIVGAVLVVVWAILKKRE